VFVRLDWKKLTNDKNSSLLRKFVNYDRKKFYNVVTRTILEISRFMKKVFFFVVEVIDLSSG